MAVATVMLSVLYVVWLPEQDDLCNIQLKDYTSILLGKTTITKDGLINSFSMKIRYRNEYKNKNWEGQFIEITGTAL